jgi:subtilisin family serine protease
LRRERSRSIILPGVPAIPTEQASASQATPHVAGTVALMLGASRQLGLPDPTPGAIRATLLTTARSFPVLPDRAIGAGILDAGAAVASLYSFVRADGA